MAVFWVVAPCSLVEVYQRYRGRLLAASIIRAMSINQLIFVMVKCSVFFAVRTEFLNII
jgi:hypothetical protein